MASLLPAIQEEHGWTTGEMLSISSMTTFGMSHQYILACLTVARMTNQATTDCNVLW
jgi:hypothetical protein